MSLRVLPESYHQQFLASRRYPAMRALAENGPIPLRALTSVPVWALRSSKCIGSGEFPELADCARWAKGAGFSGILTLPTASRSGDESPYNADSLNALDPVYLRLKEVPEVNASEKARKMLAASADEIARLNALPRVDHNETRRLKEQVLRAAFDELCDGKETASRMAGAGNDFCRANAGWLDEHAAFRVLAGRFPGQYCLNWRAVQPGSAGLNEFLAAPANQHEFRFQRFIQWLCDEQHTKYNRECAELGVPVYGDLPYAPGRHSSDYWFHQAEFLQGVSVGSLPDAFSAEGQCWCLPIVDPGRFRLDPSFTLRAPRVMKQRHFYGLRADHGIGHTNPCVIPDGQAPKDGYRLFAGLPGDDLAYCLDFYNGLREMGFLVFSENLGKELPHLKHVMEMLGIGEMGVFRWARFNQFGEFIAQDLYHPLGTMCLSTHDITTVAKHMKDLRDPDHASYPGGDPYTEKEKADLRNEREFLLRSLGWHDLPEFNADLFTANVNRLAYGNSYQVVIPLGDVLACHSAYYDQDLWQINRPGVANSDKYHYNWNWVVPDWQELKEQRTERARFIRDYFRTLFIASGRFDATIAA